MAADRAKLAGRIKRLREDEFKIGEIVVRNQAKVR